MRIFCILSVCLPPHKDTESVEFKDGFVESCCFLGHIKRFFAKDSYQCNICIVASHPISDDGNPFLHPTVTYLE